MLLNFTPHPVVIKDAEGTITTIPTTGKSLRVQYHRIAHPVRGIGIRVDRLQPYALLVSEKTPAGTVLTDMPAVEEGVYYIVSALAYVQAIHLNRPDLLCPDTDLAETNEKGHVLSVPGFAVYDL